jgi:hypothetical protein
MPVRTLSSVGLLYLSLSGNHKYVPPEICTPAQGFTVIEWGVFWPRRTPIGAVAGKHEQ